MKLAYLNCAVSLESIYCCGILVVVFLKFLVNETKMIANWLLLSGGDA